MIAELGHAALWLAAALAGLQVVFALLRGQAGAAALPAIRAIAGAQALLALLAFAALLHLFWVTDLSVALVATHSHGDKLPFYKLAAAWGNHEGSMLLWVLLLSGFGALMARFARALEPAVMRGALGMQGALALGFYAFLLLSSNPFARLDPPALEGRGLNPLLQDPGLVFHPPTLYVGYVGLSVAFSLAIGAMLGGRVDAALARAMRPWVLLSWTFLTAGILGGSYWAYYELGWGGYWFWDPVENASLLPWLAATALLHSVSVLAAREALRAWTMALALIGFAMSMLGTFLVRSGLLTSVHAFAVDPERGTFILVLMALYVGGALALFGARIAQVREGAPFAPASREGALVANNLLLSVILALVLFGTFYPLVAEAFGASISVGPPYFNLVAGPLALLLVALLFVGPLLSWKRQFRPLSKGAALAGCGALAMLVATIALGWSMSLLERLGLALGAGLVIASLVPLLTRKPWRAPAPVWGMVLAHLGVGLLTVGIASESAFTKERLAIVQPGDQASVGPWLVEFRAAVPVAGPNWTAIEADLLASRGAGAARLAPQQRLFNQPATSTSESALLTRWDGQLYATVGQGSAAEGWQLRLWWKPFVTFIWAGGLLIALGGLVSLVGRIVRALREARPARASARYREQRSW
ncbi:heme lyase CcmF/NrfE family subunit [Sphingomicrobium astaxanthinifaciens]|uniref:heme lyase CcmF/NrfE family subunit n=1 Tax=Sphingomicrobium astaxanthinifaciens TaxID=1227949 RepID=UPI001FCAA04E|nr:heme lyase CcmF/NrfE family subunit [Sphingomicrobium astaxanthinifaciens]MCJ7420258.1 heme lyase CcmF/NrfE family subunit [Sphingomicrobium astaxanthinifaciens]